MYPALSREAKARDAQQARWQAEQKARNRQLADRIGAVTEQIRREKRERALQRALEDGVTVCRDMDCEIIRSLFVATRDQVQALIAALECDGLE